MAAFLIQTALLILLAYLCGLAVGKVLIVVFGETTALPPESLGGATGTTGRRTGGSRLAERLRGAPPAERARRVVQEARRAREARRSQAGVGGGAAPAGGAQTASAAVSGGLAQRGAEELLKVLGGTATEADADEAQKETKPTDRGGERDGARPTGDHQAAQPAALHPPPTTSETAVTEAVPHAEPVPLAGAPGDAAPGDDHEVLERDRPAADTDATITASNLEPSRADMACGTDGAEPETNLAMGEQPDAPPPAETTHDTVPSTEPSREAAPLTESPPEIAPDAEHPRDETLDDPAAAGLDPGPDHDTPPPEEAVPPGDGPLPDRGTEAELDVAEEGEPEPPRDEAGFDEDQPIGLEAPRGFADNLKRIRGIGAQNERRLNLIGIWHYNQIAEWTEREAEWVSEYLGFPGRVLREDWVGQAAILAAGVETEYSLKVDRREAGWPGESR